MTQILSSYELIDRLVRQTFGVEPDVMATLAHGDAEVQLRRLPDTKPASDLHDGVEVFVRRVVAISVAMRHHRGAVTLYTDQQARAAGWPSARLANRAIILSWALYISQGETLFVPLLLEADEDDGDYADVLLGIDIDLPAFDVLRHELYGNCSVVTDPVEQIDETHMAAPICRGRHLVRLDALAAEWFGIDTAAISLPSDLHYPKMKSAKARGVALFVWLINEALDLGADMRREMIEAVRVKTDGDAAVAAEPGAKASNAVLLLAASIRHGEGWTVHTLQPRDGVAAALVEAGRRMQEDRRRAGGDEEAKTAIYYEAQDFAAREHVHVGRRNINRVAWRLIEATA